MKKISVIIPVLKLSGFLDFTLARLINDSYRNKEIIVVIDEPSHGSLILARKFEEDAIFIFNEKRVGKTKALNKAVSCSTGGILFFLDSDNIVGGDNDDTLTKLVNEMKQNDIVEFQIDVMNDSFISKMVSFEFANANMANILYSRYSRKKPIINGAAFAVKREIFYEIGGFRDYIAEDLDFGWRVFEKMKSYSHICNIKIFTKAPSNLKSWWIQRRRWATGAAEWFLKNYKSVTIGTIKNALSVTIPSILILFPIAVLGIINLFLSDSTLESVAIVSLAFLPLKIPQSTPVVLLLFSGMTMVKNAIMYAVGFVISISQTYFACRIMGRKFSVIKFVIFYYVYSPVTLFMLAYGFFRVGILRNLSLSDWKV